MPNHIRELQGGVPVHAGDCPGCARWNAEHVTVTFDRIEFRVLIRAIELADEDLSYRVSELADTGDYEPEDIARMQKDLILLRQLAERIGGL